MDVTLWFADWAAQYGDFPDDYLVIDVETTGKDIERDLIIELGWCKVHNQTVVENRGIVLNWTKSPFVDPNWVKRKIAETRKSMLEKDVTFPWSFDDLRDGQDPTKALTQFLYKLAEARDYKQILVAHNGMAFDMPILTTHFKRFLNINYQFKSEEVWDTGALEKASQLDDLLCYNEKPGDFAYRTLMRSGDGNISWSLHNHCIPKYGLDTKYGLDLTKSHTAPFDAYVSHLLFEEFRQLATRKDNDHEIHGY